MKVYIVTVMDPFYGYTMIKGVYMDKAKAEAVADSFVACVGVSGTEERTMEIQIGGAEEYEVEE